MCLNEHLLLRSRIRSSDFLHDFHDPTENDFYLVAYDMITEIKPFKDWNEIKEDEKYKFS